MMSYKYFKGSKNILNMLDSLIYKYRFKMEHPDYFDPFGLLIFCGEQGSGKTLSTVQYCKKILEDYPKCWFVTNVQISGLPEHTTVIDYDGIESLKLENGQDGILYLIDEIHLEFNSLESKNISIEEMTEFAQQRKQRKHIVGTTQVFGRLAKPLREQFRNVIACFNLFGLVQLNRMIDTRCSEEVNGVIKTRYRKMFVWFHSPKLYDSYDTYAKMKRYKKEWKGHGRKYENCS